MEQPKEDISSSPQQINCNVQNKIVIFKYLRFDIKESLLNDPILFYKTSIKYQKSFKIRAMNSIYLLSYCKIKHCALTIQTVKMALFVPCLSTVKYVIDSVSYRWMTAQLDLFPKFIR